MAKCWVFNISYGANLLWKIIRTFLDTETRNKVTLTRANTCPDIQAKINPQQLLTIYGGVAATPDACWPPYVPPTSCAGPDTQLVSSGEYQRLVEERPNL
jgi:hypothetical protein